MSRKFVDLQIDARAIWSGEVHHCRRLYRIFAEYFGGDFGAIRRYYRWTRPAMVKALRIGRTVA